MVEVSKSGVRSLSLAFLDFVRSFADFLVVALTLSVCLARISV